MKKLWYNAINNKTWSSELFEIIEEVIVDKENNATQ